MISILRDAGLSALVQSDSLEPLAQGFQFTEGPLELADGSLLFEDIKAERTHRLTADGHVHILRENTRGANGQTFGPDGLIYFCEQNGRRISRMKTDGTAVETVVESWQGGRLNSPNDIAARASNGWLYFTDPPYGVAPADRSLHFQGVYAIDKQGGLHLLLDDFEKPNGLAFSPDESTLYVCDTARYHVRAFDVDGSGRIVIGSGRVFARQDPGKPGGPDGMKVDRDGRVYVAVALGVWVYAPDGRLLGILEVPERPSNLAWRGDGKTLAMTAVDKVYQVRLNVAGEMPPFRS
jgi:gluconolactonase